MTNWKYETRFFLDADPADVRTKLEEAVKNGEFSRVEQKETDTYCVSGATDIAVRVRGSGVKMKGPEKAVDDFVDQMYDSRAWLPVSSSVVADKLGLPKDSQPTTLNTLDDVKQYMAGKGSKTSEVAKDMVKYVAVSGSLEVEVTRVEIDGTTKYTVCVAGNDAKKVGKAAKEYGIRELASQGAAQKMHYAEAVKQFGK